MRTSTIIAFIAVMTSSAVVTAQQTIIDGSESAIRVVVSGKTCVGEDTIKFGEIVLGATATFERIGHRRGVYSVGYGTILIERDGDLHGHLTSVSVSDQLLYLSTGTYQCR